MGLTPTNCWQLTSTLGMPVICQRALKGKRGGGGRSEPRVCVYSVQAASTSTVPWHAMLWLNSPHNVDVHNVENQHSLTQALVGVLGVFGVSGVASLST